MVILNHELQEQSGCNHRCLQRNWQSISYQIC